jgi:hypothetical protein
LWFEASGKGEGAVLRLEGDEAQPARARARRLQSTPSAVSEAVLLAKILNRKAGKHQRALF